MLSHRNQPITKFTKNITSFTAHTPEQQIAIESFLLGLAVGRGTTPFAARDLVGAENRDHWDKTPLNLIWEHNHIVSLTKFAGEESSAVKLAYAYEQSGKDVGKILKAVLIQSRFIFDLVDVHHGNVYQRREA